MMFLTRYGNFLELLMLPKKPQLIKALYRYDVSDALREFLELLMLPKKPQ